MGTRQDRISNLPDPILQYILSLMPLKSAIRTSLLSTRWRDLWIYNLVFVPALDFGEDFATSQSPKEFVATVNRYLQLYEAEQLDKFRVLFCPFDMFLLDIERWVAFAASKGVRELDLDLSHGYRDPHSGGFNDGRDPFRLPVTLFGCDWMTHVSLSRCELCDPMDFSSFSNLQSLSLSHVNITEDMLHSLLIHCSLLESLTLKNCHQLIEIRVEAPDLRLQRLVMADCWGGYKLWVSAPNLQSFHYNGNLFFHNYFTDVSSLIDASICSIGRDCANDRDYLKMLTDVSHVKILTLCTASLVHVTTAKEFNQLPNLQELQILMDSMTDEHLTCIYSFFKHCSSPFIEKLFIQLPGNPEAQIDITYAVTADLKPTDVAFNHLKAIKVGNFNGSRNEMRLVKFLLSKAIVLQTLVLVVPQRPDLERTDGDHSELVSQSTIRERKALRILEGQLSLLPKASHDARILLCEFVEDDDSLSPTHKEAHYDYKYFSNGSGYSFQPPSLSDIIIN